MSTLPAARFSFLFHLRNPPVRRYATTRRPISIHGYSDASGAPADHWPHPIYASQRIESKKSIFLAHASHLPSASPLVLRSFLEHLTSQPALKRATHCMYAWRVESGNVSNSVNIGPALTGQNDGGESGAGDRLARLLEATNSMNVVVVVSRWYGGVPLGSARWKMISGVAKDALAQGDFSADALASQAGKVDTRSINSHSSNNKKKRKK